VHVLVATDGSPATVDAAQRAVALLAPPDLVTVLTVLTTVPEDAFPEELGAFDEDEYDEPLYSPEQRDRQWDAAIGEASADIERTIAAFRTATKVESRIEAGDVADTIVSVALDILADLIVLGTGKHSKVRQLTHRTVTDRVIRDAPCAVLVIPEG
jgi:nucleotide-binding universal stress UspA family protein